MADYGKLVFLFSRDLRISDNTGLIEASQALKRGCRLFIFDPRQGARNPYFSPDAFQFMTEALKASIRLDERLQLRRKTTARSHDFQAPASADAKCRTL
jgi:deoxyribodipyrimidine photolyase